MTRLVVATGNAGKLREIRALLPDSGVEWVGLADVGPVDFPDEGDDYAANAIAKARAVVERTGQAAVADDSGIEVAALGGRPGPHSARYGGDGLDDAGRVALLLREIAASGSADRSARFVCHAALVLPGAEARGECVVGTCEGTILEQPRGRGGFGYDPVFLPTGEGAAMAELPPERKNVISHRARAFAALSQTASWASWLST